jgi:hypothetical protein
MMEGEIDEVVDALVADYQAGQLAAARRTAGLTPVTAKPSDRWRRHAHRPGPGAG